MRNKRILTIGIFLSLGVLSARGVYAADEDIPYAVRIPYRIARGAANIALGWTEIFLRPVGERETESVSEAAVQGMSNTFIRMSAGAADLITFWVPDLQMTELYPDWQGWPYLFHWS